MKLPYTKSMYAEHTENHFKLYCPIQEDGIFVNIYMKKKGGIPFVFDELFKKYKLKGMSELDAAIKAKNTLEDFFDVCSDLSNKKIRPFKLRIIPIDVKKFKKKR